MKEKDVNFTVKPVAWANDVITKYQAFVRMGRKVFCGEPANTEDDAMESLEKEMCKVEYMFGVARKKMQNINNPQ